MSSYHVRRNGLVFHFPDLAHASRRYGTTPDGQGDSWDDYESVDVDQPLGLAYRHCDGLAIAVRKRINKEHVAFADATVGGEHVPGYTQVVKQVDATSDVSTAKDNTLFQANGLVHSAGNQTLWCITAAGTDPTILLLDPDKQYKGGDITWTGAQQFDASVDMTILHVDASFSAHGAGQFDGTVNFVADVDMTDVQINGNLTVKARADTSSFTAAGDSTFQKAVQFDGTIFINGIPQFGASAMYDSTWFDISQAGSYTKTHDLSSTALLTQMYFKDTQNQFSLGANRIYNMNSWWASDAENGGWVQNITATQLTAHAGASYVANTLNATGDAINCTCGQYRIIALRLI